MKYRNTLTTILSVVLLAVSSLAFARDYTAVNTAQGRVIGSTSDDLVVFKGVPYATPPIGDLRWRAPQPPARFTKPLVADTFGQKCIQRPPNPNFAQKPERYTQEESEDCLYLNIYRPDNGDSDLPVMVWIPGGGLVSGSGSRPVNYGGNLAKRDVIVVAINYRLGAFGFFAHPDLSAQNADNGRLFNYGLMDQIAALEWVQQNIERFGGNPSNVTIFGESAGAYSVQALVASQAGKGLFHKAISQSGYGRGEQPKVAAQLAKEDESIEAMGVAMAAKLGDEGMNIAALRDLPAEDILGATDYTSFIEFAVDGKLIRNDIETLFQTGQQAKVPLLIGANDFEFGMVPHAAQRNIMAPLLPEGALDKLAEVYGGEQLRDTMLYSDYVFHAQARLVAQAHEKQGNSVYVYRFAMPVVGATPFNYAQGKVWGAPHASDLPYLFGNFTGDHGESTEPDETMLMISAQMMRYWTNFAKKGNPNGTELTQWPQYKGKKIALISPDGIVAKTDNWLSRLKAVNAYFDH